MGAGSDGGTARAAENGPRRAGGRLSGHDGSRVGVQDEAGGFEFRRTGRAAGARRVVWTHGRCDRAGARVGRE
jgi:hypothetical protein